MPSSSMKRQAGVFDKFGNQIVNTNLTILFTSTDIRILTLLQRAINQMIMNKY